MLEVVDRSPLRFFVCVAPCDQLFEGIGEEARNRRLPFDREVFDLSKKSFRKSQRDVLDFFVLSFHDNKCNTSFRVM